MSLSFHKDHGSINIISFGDLDLGIVRSASKGTNKKKKFCCGISKMRLI